MISAENKLGIMEGPFGSLSDSVRSFLNKAMDLLDWGKSLIALVSFIMLGILFLIALFMFRKRCKKITIKQIENYSSAGKFIKGLFVELNDSREYIRAFCFSKLWKHRIIRKYNILFNDKMGKELPHVYVEGNQVNVKISNSGSIKKTRKEIEKTKLFLHRIGNRELTCNPEYKNTNMLYECFGSNYIKSIDKIDQMAALLDSQYLIVTGTAGNGKSMMLCSVAEQLVKGKDTVLFLNARDVQEELISYLAKQVMSQKLKCVYSLWWLLQRGVHFVTGRYIYIILDAINENNSEEFRNKLTESIGKLLRSKRVKVIISCRSEYFELRYKGYMLNSNLEKKSCFLKLQEGEYTNEARERLLANYARHYGFSGELSETVKEKIMRQLLLVKILFEVYRGRNDRIYELNKYEVYKKYIDGNNNTTLNTLLDQLSQYMFENKRFENVPISELNRTFLDYDTIDSSILVRRDIIKNEGSIREETIEVINFVYDEMRDYRLSKYLLSICVDENENIDSNKVKQHLEDLAGIQAHCLEGIVNYLFHAFLSEKNNGMLEYLLFDVIKKRDDMIDGFRNRNNKHISSWGLMLLFETNSIELDVGKKYVDYILHDNPGKEGRRVLTYLLRQEFLHGEYTLGILLDALKRADNSIEVAERIEHTISSWSGEGITYYDLVECHRKLVKVNNAGAERLWIYMFLTVTFCEWNGKHQVDDYLLKSPDCERCLERIKAIF